VIQQSDGMTCKEPRRANLCSRKEETWRDMVIAYKFFQSNNKVQEENCWKHGLVGVNVDNI
jgi:hypothetical protein